MEDSNDENWMKINITNNQVKFMWAGKYVYPDILKYYYDIETSWGGWGSGYAGESIGELCSNLKRVFESFEVNERKAKITIESKIRQDVRDFMNGIIDNEKLKILKTNLSEEGYEINMKY